MLAIGFKLPDGWNHIKYQISLLLHIGIKYDDMTDPIYNDSEVLSLLDKYRT
jgi:hypothetical protein